MAAQAEQQSYLMVKITPAFEDMLNELAADYAAVYGLAKPDKSAYVRHLILCDRQRKINRKKAK